MQAQHTIEFTIVLGNTRCTYMKNAKATQKNKMCVCDRGKWTLVVKGTILESVWVRFLGLEDPLEKDRLPTPVFLGFRGGSDSKESICNAGDLGLIPGLGRSPGRGHGNPFQYSCLENPHGQRCLVGYSPWDHKESDTTEQLSTAVLYTNPRIIPIFTYYLPEQYGRYFHIPRSYYFLVQH